MCKQPSTVQTTQNSVQSVPQYVQTAQQLGLTSGANMLGSYLGLDPNTRVAGLNADQTTAYDLTRQLAQGAFTNPTPSSGMTAPTSPTLSSGTALTNYVPATAASAGPAAQVTGDSIHALLNPYTRDVVDTTNQNLRRQYETTGANQDAQMAAAGGFGGSRQAIQSAQLARSFGEQQASTTANLMAQGYTQAQATALANAQMQNQMAISNAQMQQQANMANAGAENSANQFNASAQNTQQNQGNNNLLQQYGLDLNRYTTQSQLGETANTNQYNRQLQAINAMLGTGNAQQTQLQNILNVPTDALRLYAAMMPNQYGSTTNTVGTAPNTAPGLGQQALGAGLSILGLGTGTGTTLGGSLLGGLFCDARLKKGIAFRGVESSGRPIFSFRYAWESDDAPERVGPMAQIEEIRVPGSVIEILGIKYVTRH